MISIEKSKIEQIPFLHIAQSNKKNSELPLIIFLHGFTSTKERNLNYSYLLAEKGFRVILPEANYHGSRSSSLTEEQLNFKFWEIVIQSIAELPIIKNYFEEQNLIANGRIGLAGTSMGGITTLGALTQYDWIKAAVSLMGAPSYKQFANYQLQSLGGNELIRKAEVEMIMEELTKYDLSLQPEKLENRPLMFWHGKRDDVVPYKFTHNFYETNRLKSEIKLISDEEADHKVTQEGIKETVNWLTTKLL